MTREDFVKTFGAEELRSRTGGTVAKLSKLKDTKYREEYGLYLAEGVKLTEEALASCPVCDEIFTGNTAEVRSEIRIDMVFVSEDALENDRVMACVRLAHEKKIPVRLASPEAFEKVATEKAPQGIITVLKRPAGGRFVTRHDARYLLLDTIQDPGNLGTILRSAVAFGADGVILYRCADPTGPKTVRASMGAQFRCPVMVSEDLEETVRHLQREGHRVLAAALAEDCLCAGKTPLLENDCIIIGNEGHGIAENVMEACDAVIRIPMQAVTESLNASIAASILLWEYSRTFGLDN